MRVSDALTSSWQILATCTPPARPRNQSRRFARLSSLNLGVRPACGVVCERDVAYSFAKDGAKLADRRVDDLMTKQAIACEANASKNEAERVMRQRRVRHSAAVEGSNLVGMLSIRDVMVWRLQELRTEVNVLRDAMIVARHR